MKVQTIRLLPLIVCLMIQIIVIQALFHKHTPLVLFRTSEFLV